MIVLAVDPGVTTGLAYVDGSGHTAFSLPYPEDEDWIVKTIGSGHIDMVVCERFQLGQGTLKKTQAGSLSTIERIGVTRWAARKAGARFELQTPAEAKEFDPRWQKIKRMGWETPGPGDHSKSASRHLLLALVRLGIVDPRELLSPQEE